MITVRIAPMAWEIYSDGLTHDPECQGSRRYAIDGKFDPSHMFVVRHTKRHAVVSAYEKPMRSAAEYAELMFEHGCADIGERMSWRAMARAIRKALDEDSSQDLGGRSR